MDFTRRVDIDALYDDVVARVKDALEDQGFGVLTEIDVRQTLKTKLDVDVDAQVILGACNPQLAHRALGVDARIAALLPCNVVVRAEGDRTIVEALDPKLIADVPGNPDLAPIGDEAGERITAALNAVAAT